MNISINIQKKLFEYGRSRKNFTKGFNNGYLIAKYQPDLFEKIEKSSNPTNEYFQGLLSGKEEHEHEKNAAHLKNLSEKKTFAKENKDIEKEK